MPGPIANAAAGAARTFNEAVVKPTTDEVGKMIEQGVQTAIGQTPKQLDPQEIAKKKADDERKKRNILMFLQRYNQDRQSLITQRQREEQEKLRKLQEEEAKKAKVRQIEIQKKQQMQAVAVQQAQTRSERKQGVGG